MDHLPSTLGGPPPEEDRLMPIDDPDDPMAEAVLPQLELDRAADEGMTEPPGPEMDLPPVEMPGTEMPGPEDEPRPGVDVPGPEDEPRPGVDVPGTEVPGPGDEPRRPGVEMPGHDAWPPIVTGGSLAAGLPARPG